jgi:hypothetical protein
MLIMTIDPLPDAFPDAVEPGFHYALDPGFHGVPAGPAHRDRGADGADLA